MTRKYTQLCNNILKEFKKRIRYIFRRLQISTPNLVSVFEEINARLFSRETCACVFLVTFNREPEQMCFNLKYYQVLN